MSSWQMFFLGGGKCPNLGLVNARILGVVNVLLANDSQSKKNVSVIRSLSLNEKEKERLASYNELRKNVGRKSFSNVLVGYNEL